MAPLYFTRKEKRKKKLFLDLKFLFLSPPLPPHFNSNQKTLISALSIWFPIKISYKIYGIFFSQRFAMANKKIDGQDRMNQYDDKEYEDSPSSLMLMEDSVSLCDVGSRASSSSSRENNKSRSEIGLMERLTDILVNEGDGDLLLQQSDWEDRILQWSVLGQGREQYGAMIGNDENSGFMGFALLGLWVSICCVFFFYSVFGSSSRVWFFFFFGTIFFS